MSITSLNDLINSAKQFVSYTRTGARTSTAFGNYTVLDQVGSPGAGTLAGSSTAAGVVPDDSVSGYPIINAFGGSATGYLAGANYNWDVTGRLVLYDRLFLAGAYSFNSNVTLAAQPSYSTRVPGGAYTDLELWFECVIAFTGNPTITVTYMNQAGTTAHSTGAVAFGFAPIVGQCYRLPLQAGDTGLQKIESVLGAVATVGTFNLMVLRRLDSARINVVNQGVPKSFIDTKLPIVYANSALYLMAVPDSTSTGHPDMNLVVANN